MKSLLWLLISQRWNDTGQALRWGREDDYPDFSHHHLSPGLLQFYLTLVGAKIVL